MQPIVVVTNPDGKIEAFSSVQFAIEENGFESGQYTFYLALGNSDLHRDSARGMTLPEVYLHTMYHPNRRLGFSPHWYNPNNVVIVARKDSPTKQWTMQFTYLYV